jgi:hypothetical protein
LVIVTVKHSFQIGNTIERARNRGQQHSGDTVVYASLNATITYLCS